MVACGNDRDARAQKIDGDFSRYAAPARRVFAVNDDEIQRVLRLQLRQPGNDCAAAGLANDIAEKKNA